MRLLSLDYDPVYGEDADRSRFSSDVSVFDYDIVIWDPAASFSTYGQEYESYYQNLPSFSEHTSVKIRGDAARRRAEFIDFINSGRTLVIMVCPPQQCYVDTGRRTHSGTGRNRATTVQVDSLDLLSAMPVKQPIVTRAQGNRIELQGGGPITALLRKYQNHMTYEAVMKEPPGAVLAQVTGTDRVVAALQRSAGGGHLILLPRFDFEIESTDDEAEDEDEDAENIWSEEALHFQTDLLAAVEQLSGTKTVSRPGWAEHYTTTSQRQLAQEVVRQQERIERARKRLATFQQQKEEVDAPSQLFLGSGRALELEVRDVLQILGGIVSEPEPGRDDWKVTFPEDKAVVEVKGVNKSAAEKHAAQLEKWVASDFEESEQKPKGILIANTWREHPLDQRNQEDFPAQMLPYCKSRGHCLITGLELFIIRQEVEQDPAKAESWRRKILETSGRLEGVPDWQTYLEQASEADTEADSKS